MRSKKSNKQVRNTIRTATGLSGIKTLELPGAVELKQNKKWIDSWMLQNEKIRKVKANPVSFSKSHGLIIKWWEN